MQILKRIFSRDRRDHSFITSNYLAERGFRKKPGFTYVLSSQSPIRYELFTKRLWIGETPFYRLVMEVWEMEDVLAKFM